MRSCKHSTAHCLPLSRRGSIQANVKHLFTFSGCSNPSCTPEQPRASFRLKAITDLIVRMISGLLFPSSRKSNNLRQTLFSSIAKRNCLFCFLTFKLLKVSIIFRRESASSSNLSFMKMVLNNKTLHNCANVKKKPKAQVWRKSFRSPMRWFSTNIDIELYRSSAIEEMCFVLLLTSACPGSRDQTRHVWIFRGIILEEESKTLSGFSNTPPGCRR